MFARLLLGIALAFSVCFGVFQGASAQDAASPQLFTRGRVMEVVEDTPGEKSILGEAQQVVLVELLGGPDQGRAETITYIFSASSYEQQRLETGDVVVLSKLNDARGEQYYILDHYRLSTLAMYAVLFAFAALLFGRLQGAGSLVGLGASLAVLMLFIVPRIIAGDNPIVISLIGSAMIAVVSILLAHGLKTRTYVALAATLCVLIGAFGLAMLAAAFANLSGTGTEEAVYLQLSYLPNLNLRGLLLGGVIIGTLGVLDDVTTAQVAAVEEISLANPSLGVAELYRRGSSVGREHIAALVNTLVLAYAGASFPLFLLFALPDHPPLWVILNGENIVEEVLRALVGGTSLMLAVPVATALAAAVFGSLPHTAAVNDQRKMHIH